MIPLDKLLHFLSCFVIAAALYLILGNVWVGAGAAMIIGAAKDVIDSRNPINYFSWLDMVANAIGVLAFLCCYYLGRLLWAA